MRVVFFTTGSISLALGFAGIFLPGLPTTPFILLSTWCYSKSSDRFHNWLLNHKMFGKMISDFHLHGTISRKTKLLAYFSLFLMSAISLYFLQSTVLRYITFAGIITGAIVIFLLPSSPKSGLRQSSP